MSGPAMERIDELSADRALWGLDTEAERELDRVLDETGRDLDDSWEHSAAVALLAMQGVDPGPPPQRLMAKLRAAAPIAQEIPAPAERTPRAAPWTPLLAAAVVILSVALFLKEGPRPTDEVATAELYRALAARPGVTLWTWQAGDVRGDVVWDAASQKGYMRFDNLPVNDPRERQYQLWIVDGRRNAAHPVDGGVFDIPTNGDDVVVPIDAKIHVHAAQAFVVTAENPGGVVVSDREHIVALAKPE